MVGRIRTPTLAEMDFVHNRLDLRNGLVGRQCHWCVLDRNADSSHHFGEQPELHVSSMVRQLACYLQHCLCKCNDMIRNLATEDIT